MGRNYPNQFGFDLGDVKNTVSNLKTAKLKQKKMEVESATEEAQSEYLGNALAKKKPGATVAPVDENEDGQIDAAETKNAIIATGRKYKGYTTDKESDEKTAKHKSDLNRTNVLNASTRAASKRADAANARAEKVSQRLEKADAAKTTYIDAMERYEAGIGMPVNVVNANKEARKAGETPLSGKNMDYNDNVKVNTLLKTIDGVGKSFMNFETPEEGNKFIAEGKARYMKASDPKAEEYNPAVAERTKEVLDLLPENFKTGDDKAVQEFQDFKGHLTADLTVKQQEVKAKWAESQERLQNSKWKNSTRDLRQNENQQKVEVQKDNAEIRKIYDGNDDLKYQFSGNKGPKLLADAEKWLAANKKNGGTPAQAMQAAIEMQDGNQPEKKKKGKNKFVEGKLYEQNGVKYKYTNGKFVPQK